jgi:Fe-S-cluster containining protein
MTLEQMFDSMSLEEYDRISKHIAVLSNFYKNTKDKNQAVRMIYSWVDKQISEYPDKAKKQIKCGGKGCSFCCNIHVMCSLDEAQLIKNYAESKGIQIDKQRLKKQSKLTVGDYILSPHKRCVFLDNDGSCKVYDVRPLACRMHNAVTPVELCDTDKSMGAETASYAEPHVYAAVIALSQFSTINGMSKHLFNLIK